MPQDQNKPPDRTHCQEVTPFETKDGSLIRELMHPSLHACENMSLAEATVAAGQSTQLHFHPNTEEFYYILSGKGLMRLAEQCFNVLPGDSIAIPPGTTHNIKNTGNDPLRLLCCCSPAYSHDDTVLLEGNDLS